MNMNMNNSFDMHQVHATLQSLGVEILDADADLVRCPGEHLHTGPNNPRDCKVFGTPRKPMLRCFHSSCAAELDRINMLLRDGPVMTAPGNPAGHTPSAVSAPAPVVNPARINQVLAQHPWDYKAIDAACPQQVSQIPIDLNVRALLLLFYDEDVLWFGNTVYDSGRPHHSCCFRTKRAWWNYTRNFGNFTCPSTFRPGSFSRSTANVQDRRYLGVESDILSRNEVGSVFKWMQQQGHVLRAVVDTAGKSLHGWFEFPGKSAIPQLKRDLVQLGCDPAMFGASQPCRLPGGLRNNKFQKLIYLQA